MKNGVAVPASPDRRFPICRTCGVTAQEYSVINGHSKIRNKGIANIFSQMGLVEAWGNGIKRIFNAAEEYGLQKPRFQEFDNMFRVELFRNSFPMINEKENIGESSENHRRSLGETSEVEWRTDLNDTQGFLNEYSSCVRRIRKKGNM